MSEPAATGPANAPRPGDAEALPSTTATRRPWPLTVLLALVVLANAIGLWQGVTRRAELFTLFPKLSPLAYGAWLAAPALAIAGCAGLWALRRWGLWAITVAWVIAGVADMTMGATSNALFVTAATWLVIIAVRPVRHALR